MSCLREKQTAMRLRQQVRTGPTRDVNTDALDEAHARVRLYVLHHTYGGDLAKLSEVSGRPISWLRTWVYADFPLK